MSRDETSIWKKEISLRRKPKEAKAPVSAQPAAKPESQETSVWKKEISFRRKPKAEATTPAAPPAQASPAEPSVWKKEISLRRKPKEAKAPVSAQPAAKPESQETSVWKKEISFRRKQDASTPEAPAAPADSSEPSIWKREITLGRKPKAEQEPSSEPVVPVSPPTVAAPAPAPPPPPASVPAAPTRPTQTEAPSPAPQPAAPPVTPPAVPRPAPAAPPAAPSEPVPVSAEASGAEATAVLPPAAEPAREPTEAEPPADQAPTRRFARPALSIPRPARQKSKTAASDHPSKHRRVVGLKVGASQIAAAEVVNKDGRKVVRLARAPLERGVVVGGELRDAEKLASALKTFFRKNRLGQTKVRLGVSNNRIGVRTFEITGIEDEQQLANAIRFRAQEALPIPLDEAVLDYRILDERVDESGQLVRQVLLVVAHRELVERYAAACRKAGLKLIGIDLEAFALLRALADPEQPPAEDAAIVCISIGHDRSTLAVSDGHVCEFTRVLSWGGASMDVALARALDLTPSRAEAIKLELPLDGEGGAAGLDPTRADDARRVLAAEVQTFAREIVASLRFYQEQPGSLGIGEIRITGGTASCEGLASELERLIGLPVRVADPLQRVTVPRRLTKGLNGSTGSLAVAIGLGIED